MYLLVEDLVAEYNDKMSGGSCHLCPEIATDITETLETLCDKHDVFKRMVLKLLKNHRSDGVAVSAPDPAPSVVTTKPLPKPLPKPRR